MLAWFFAAAAFSCDPGAGVVIVAHRGGMDSGYPENTLPAFRHAALVGADAIELDLRATRDGEVVVLHDATVDRTTDGHGPVSALSAAELGRLDVGGGVRIPTLDDVLADADLRDIGLLFDVKPAPGLDLRAVAAQIRARQRLGDVIFGVRSLEDHARLARIEPGLRFVGLISGPRDAGAFLDAGVGIVRLWPTWIAREPALIEAIHATGGRVWVTAGRASVEELSRLAALGVDGFLTDTPARSAALGTCGRGR